MRGCAGERPSDAHSHVLVRGIWGLGLGIRSLGFGVWGVGFGVWGVGFGVWGLGFGVSGVGVGVKGPTRGLARKPCEETLNPTPELLFEAHRLLYHSA